MRYLNKIHNYLRYMKLKKSQIYINHNAFVSGSFDKWEGNTYIKGGCSIYNCEIGRGTYIRNDCDFFNTKIGRFASIAPRVRLVCGMHPVKGNVCMHPAFYSEKGVAGLSFHHNTGFDEYKRTINNYYCEIGNDVWIGSDVLIMGGVIIGDGAVIAAGSVVTHNVEPYSIVGGNPAKLIRYRFDEDTIKFLLEYRWWEKSIDWIKTNITLFDDIDSFIISCATRRGDPK